MRASVAKVCRGRVRVEHTHPGTQVFEDSTLPVVAYYEARGKVARVDGTRTPEEVYAATRPHFDKLLQK